MTACLRTEALIARNRDEWIGLNLIQFMDNAYILHLVPAEYFRAQVDSAPYLPSQFSADGFIHCTREPEVLLQIANDIFRNEPGEFLVLVIDPTKVTAEVRFERPIPPLPSDSPLAHHLFPHIYGPLNREAIVEIRSARRAPDGAFIEV